MMERTKPVIIIEPGAMSKKDIKKMNACGIAVVESKNPEAIRFLDPPPFDRSKHERAAIALCRILLTSGNSGTSYQRYQLSEKYVELLIQADALDERTPEPVKNVPVNPPVKAK